MKIFGSGFKNNKYWPIKILSFTVMLLPICCLFSQITTGVLENIARNVFSFLLFVILFTPSLIAICYRHEKLLYIVILNTVLIVFIITWYVALFLALTPPRKETPTISTADTIPLFLILNSIIFISVGLCTAFIEKF